MLIIKLKTSLWKYEEGKTCFLKIKLKSQIGAEKILTYSWKLMRKEAYEKSMVKT